MSENYGLMVGFNDAIKWVEQLPCPESEAEMKSRVLARMRYERDQNVPVPATKHKGKYIRDYYTCGNCGAGIDIGNRFCSNCGFAIRWREGTE